VTVLTRANNRSVIEDHLLGLDTPRPEFLYYDPPPMLLKWKRWGLPVPLFYLAWQVGARAFVSSKLQAFDIIHHVTFCSFAIPGFWWVRKPAVVLGPLGGGMTAPWNMLPAFGSNSWKEIMRTIGVNLIAYSPLLWRSYKFASAILVANAETSQRIPKRYSEKVIRMIEVGVELPVRKEPDTCSGKKIFRLIWVGTLFPRKAAILAIEALSVCRHQGIDVEMHIVGDGAERRNLQWRTKELGIENAVVWHGRVAHAEALKKIANADAFIFTSARDTAGNVVLEAMAAGLPGIVIAHQGVAEITTSETALRIPPAPIPCMITQLAAGIKTLANDSDLRQRMGEASKKRVMDCFIWERKAETISLIYQEILQRERGRK